MANLNGALQWQVTSKPQLPKESPALLQEIKGYIEEATKSSIKKKVKENNESRGKDVYAKNKCASLISLQGTCGMVQKNRH
jgi:hypothetical protein